MLLAIDVGNSNVVLGVFEADQLKAELRLATNPRWTRDEVAVSLASLLRLAGYALEHIADAVIASVVPTALPALVEALRRHVSVDPLVVGPGVRTGMPIRYDPPQDVGADRIVTAVAAHHRYHEAAGEDGGILIVDFGTATTFDVVAPGPEYLGGVIVPGVGISADALFERAARLPRVELAVPQKVVGRNTVAAMQSGLTYGYVSLVEGMIARIRAELPFSLHVVATGGFAGLIAKHSKILEVVDDALVLEGLRLIYAKNRPPPGLSPTRLNPSS